MARWSPIPAPRCKWAAKTSAGAGRELREPPRVDVAARDDDADATRVRHDLVDPPGEDRREPRRAARLDDELQAVEGEPHGVEDLGVAHEGDAGEEPAVDREGELA